MIEIITAIKSLENVQQNNPSIFALKIRPQLLKGDIEAAKKTQERAKLLNPDWKNFTEPVDSVIDYLSKNKATKKVLRRFVGKYRSQSLEQVYEYWMENDKLLCYVSNQQLIAPILAADNKLMLGSYINGNININTFLEDSLPFCQLHCFGKLFSHHLSRNSRNFNHRFLLFHYFLLFLKQFWMFQIFL